MGEIADAMIEGELCAGCGCYIGDEVGFPRYCSDACDPHPTMEQAINASKPFSCQIDGCGKRFLTQGDKRRHRRAKHGILK